MKHTVSTFVLADDELSRIGLHGILAGVRFRPIAAKGGWEAIVASGKSLPQVVILILGGTGITPEATSARIAPIAKSSKVVILSDQCEANLVRSAICAGAAAFLPRGISSAILIQTMELVLEGEVILPAEVMREVMAAKSEVSGNSGGSTSPESEGKIGRLSSREVEILKRLTHGDSNKLISRQLDIAETTVKVHVKAILRKIQVFNRTQAAIWGIDNLSRLAGTAVPDVPRTIIPEALLVPDKIIPPVISLPRNGHGRVMARS